MISACEGVSVISACEECSVISACEGVQCDKCL